MAMTTKWNDVTKWLRTHEDSAVARPTVAAMLRLLAVLRKDPRLDAVEPNLSLLSLTLRLRGIQRYVMVAWTEEPPGCYEVAFVDPPLEFSEITAYRTPRSSQPSSITWSS